MEISSRNMPYGSIYSFGFMANALKQLDQIIKRHVHGKTEELSSRFRDERLLNLIEIFMWRQFGGRAAQPSPCQRPLELREASSSSHRFPSQAAGRKLPEASEVPQ